MALETRRFTTEGMHCPSCSMLIEMNLTDLDGVQNVSSDYKSGLTTVTYDTSVLSAEQIVSAIEDSGYTARVA